MKGKGRGSLYAVEGVLKAPQQGVGKGRQSSSLGEGVELYFLIEKEVSCWRPIWVVGAPQGSIVGHCRLRAIDMSLDLHDLFRYRNVFFLYQKGKTLSLSPKDSNL